MYGSEGTNEMVLMLAVTIGNGTGLDHNFAYAELPDLWYCKNSAYEWVCVLDLD